MGNSGSSTPRAVLHTPEQLHFATSHLQKEVADITKGWLEDGMPLGLTLDMFRHVLGLGPKVDAEALFRVFDSDGNQKVDAFELLSAVIFLSDGALPEKVEALFPIFDFSGAGMLNFDEVNILLQSVCRGLTKVCGGQPAEDDELIDACRRSYDAHNLRYEKQISREQVKRWLSSDVEVTGFIHAFHQACVLPQATTAMADLQRAQLDAFAKLGGGSSGASIHELFRGDALRKALGSPSDEDMRSLAGALASAAGDSTVGQEHFAKAAQAWNAFNIADVNATGHVDEKDLRLLLWLWRGSEPAGTAVDQQRDAMGLRTGDHIARSAWIASCLQER